MLEFAPLPISTSNFQNCQSNPGTLHNTVMISDNLTQMMNFLLRILYSRFYLLRHDALVNNNVVAVFHLRVTKVLLLSIIFFTCQLFYFSMYNIQYVFKNIFYY